MASLIFNFDDSQINPNLDNKPKLVFIPPSTPGNWTHKRKEKRKVKQQIKKQKITSIEPQVEPAPVKISPVIQKPIQHHLTGTTNKLQFISSLFSSTIIPTITTPPEPDQPVTLYAPSNASLSHIQITSKDLNLHPTISKHLSTSHKLGQIKSPTGIQSIAWPILTNSGLHHHENDARDVIIQSQTGSGKTLAYLVPIIQDLLNLSTPDSSKLTRDLGTFAIILVPTRELAEQVTNVAINLLSFASLNRVEGRDAGEQKDHQEQNQLNPRWLVPGTLHGGTNRTHEKAKLRKGVPLLICTPGRLLDHLEKTLALRLAGDPPRLKETQSKNPNHEPLGQSTSVGEDRKVLDHAMFNLRWLVVDEADRLMDMGFEEQMRGILNHLSIRESKATSYWNRKLEKGLLSTRTGRRTVLCSATMPDGVKKLVGMTLNHPISLKSNDQSIPQHSASTSPNSDDKTTQSGGINRNFSAPSQLLQHYLITPPKLRLVSLIALLREIIKSSRKKNVTGKVLVFMSCTASVDFHYEALGGMSMSRSTDPTVDVRHQPAAEVESEHTSDIDEKASQPLPIHKTCPLLPSCRIFRLHGNLDLQTRLTSLKAFSKASSEEEQKSPSILLCTSLAGRGLDVPFVSHVIQYDLPTEGGVTEYLHRVGRTARAGEVGYAWSFLLPSEAKWVGWCESGQKTSATTVEDRTGNNKLRECGVQEVLKKGFGEEDWECRATDVQMAVERWVIQSPLNTSLASKAFSSHIRAYATHPNTEKDLFNIKLLHLGHLAKSFGLRDPPKRITGSFTVKDMVKPASKRQLKLANRRNRTAITQEEEGDQEDARNGPVRFIALNQFKATKNGNRLKGPVGNGVDEFNVAM